MINLISKAASLLLKSAFQPKFKPLPFQKFTPRFLQHSNSSSKPYQWQLIVTQTTKAALTRPVINYPKWLFAARFTSSFLHTQRPFTFSTGNHLVHFNLFSIFNYKSINQGEQARQNHKIKMDTVLKKEPDYRSIEEKIELFNYLLESGEEEIKKANGKDIIIIFGKTGSGKSTLINFLYGCEMIKDASDNIVVSPDSKVEEVAPIGTEISSCTYVPKQIPAITIASKTILEMNNNSEVVETHPSITLYDMPGLDDNRGVEVALANAIVIKELAQQARSVRFVMVVDHRLISLDRGRQWKETVELLIEAFGGSVGKTPNTLCLMVTKQPSGLQKIIKEIKQYTGPYGASVDLSQHAVIYNPLNPSEKNSLLNLIYEKTPFPRHSLTAKVTVGHEQLSRAQDLGEEVQKSVEKHLQLETEDELNAAVKKIQFTHGIAKLGNTKLERPHNESSKAVCDYIENLLLAMAPDLSSKLVARQITAFEKYTYARNLFGKYVKFENFDVRMHSLKDLTKDPRMIAWDKPETTIGAGLATACGIVIVATAPASAAAGAIVVTAIAGAATLKGIYNWIYPSEKDRKTTNFFKSL